jgi:hypothetical protein
MHRVQNVGAAGRLGKSACAKIRPREAHAMPDERRKGLLIDEDRGRARLLEAMRA